MEYKNYQIRFGKDFPRCKGGECTAKNSCMLYMAHVENAKQYAMESKKPCKDYQPIRINCKK